VPKGCCHCPAGAKIVDTALSLDMIIAEIAGPRRGTYVARHASATCRLVCDGDNCAGCAR